MEELSFALTAYFILTVCRRPHQLFCCVVEAFTVSFVRLPVNKERKGEITVPFSQQKLSQWLRRGLDDTPSEMASLPGSEEDINYKRQMSGRTKKCLT